MQRNALLIAFCLFLFLFCSVAAQDFFKGSPFPPEKNEASSLHFVERYNHLAGKKALYLKNPLRSSRTSDDEPDSNPVSPETKEAENNKKPTAEKAGKAADAEAEPRETKKPHAVQLPVEEKNSIHFLLMGRWWDDPVTEILVMVTLIPGGCARLTSLDPAIGVQLEGKPCPLGEMLKRGGTREQFHRAVSSLTGLTPQFYIDLNLQGFIEMISLLQQENRGGGEPSRGGKVSSPEKSFDGNEMLLLLHDPAALTETKEELLIQLLLAACEIQFSKLGFKLLWMGYHNLKTDLSLGRLLEVREITQGIAPTNVTLVEITP